jgi:hypothetical protein
VGGPQPRSRRPTSEDGAEETEEFWPVLETGYLSDYTEGEWMSAQAPRDEKYLNLTN